MQLMKGRIDNEMKDVDNDNDYDYDNDFDY